MIKEFSLKESAVGMENILINTVNICMYSTIFAHFWLARMHSVSCQRSAVNNRAIYTSKNKTYR